MSAGVGDLVTNLLGNYAPLQQTFRQANSGADAWARQTTAAVNQVQSTLANIGKGLGSGAAGASWVLWPAASPH